MGVPGGERGNVQTGRGDRMSTISLLGCSTSVALTMGPTDEEECRYCSAPLHIHLASCVVSSKKTNDNPGLCPIKGQ